jgi:hypothetical protein
MTSPPLAQPGFIRLNGSFAVSDRIAEAGILIQIIDVAKGQ